MRPISRLCLIVTLVAGAAMGLAACRRSAAPESGAAAAGVEVGGQEARAQTLRSVVTATGSVAPLGDTDLTVIAPERARIESMPKMEGEAVAAGDLLVRFDIPIRTAEVTARQLEVAQSLARVEGARAKVEQLQPLLDKGLVPRVDVDIARRELADADVALTQTRQMLVMATAAVERGAIRARFAGVVVRRWHNEGDLVEPTPADPVIRVADPKRVQVVADVPLQELAKLVPGMAAVVTPLGAAPLAATVTGHVPPMTPEAQNGEARLATVAGQPLPPIGTPVQVEILIAEAPQALVVPSAAVMRSGAATYLMVAGPDGRAHRRDVSVGLTTRELVQITSGLTAGEFVITRGHTELSDGDVVVVK